MSVDKRTVVTDALETLGNIIDENAKRDAIHVAVEPVTAAQDLTPGQHVGVDGTTYNPVGIVDPFLKSTVLKGQKFWLLLYPRQITSLRHVWSHPAFDEEREEYTKEEQAKIERVVQALDGDKIRNFAQRIGKSYEALMAAADYYVATGEEIVDNGGGYKAAWQTDWKEFWEHYEQIRGVEVERKDSGIFYCSC